MSEIGGQPVTIRITIHCTDGEHWQSWVTLNGTVIDLLRLVRGSYPSEQDAQACFDATQREIGSWLF